MKRTASHHAADKPPTAKVAKPSDGVSVKSAEGEVVAWSRSAAARSATLANWVSDMGGAEGAFATLVPAAALHTLARVAESGGAEDTKALEGCSLAQQLFV
jgi:hypothetical protein